MDPFFGRAGTWSGGFFELALELGPRSDGRLRAALSRLWAHSSLTGCYLLREAEPSDQEAVDPEALPLGGSAYGVAEIPGIGTTCCVSVATRVEDGPDLLSLGVPMGSLSQVVHVGAYPFEDGTDLRWRTLMHAWLRDVAEAVFATVPFELGLIDHEVSTAESAEGVRRDGISAKRWAGYLWPEGGVLAWFPPSEGAPLYVGRGGPSDRDDVSPP